MQEMNNMGAFHSTKISENSGSKSNRTENFRKIFSKISVNLSRLSFFSGNSEIPEIFRSTWHFLQEWLIPSSSSRHCCLDQLEEKMAALRNLQCSACFFTSDDVELFFQHDCVDNSGNAASPMGKSKTELNNFTLLMHTQFPPFV